MKTKYKTFKEMSENALFITYETVRGGYLITSKGKLSTHYTSRQISKMVDDILDDIAKHCKKENHLKYKQALLQLPNCYQLNRFYYSPELDVFYYCTAQDYRVEMAKIRKFLRIFYKNHFNK